MKKTVLFLIIGILVIAGIFFVFSDKFEMAGKTIETSEVVTIPLSEISENAKWYEYNSNRVKIRYFTVKAKDSSVKTAFDECDVCYRSKKGYKQEGEFMVCNNCGNRYPILGLGTENIRSGGCWPGYLPSRIEGDSLVIEISDLKKGEYRFK